MPKRTGRYTISMENDIFIEESAGIAGSKESEGPLGEYFDISFKDDKIGQNSWEKAESSLQTIAVNTVLEKACLIPDDIDIIFAGDLLNQCISSTFGLKELNIPFMGQYGACSTMAQTLALGAIFTDSNAANRAIAVTSSHFCSAERQFRLPLEYGGQRTPSAQWTVTGAGAALISKIRSSARIAHVTIGRIKDLDIKDANNMGAAMAPAAAETIMSFLSDTNTKISDIDLILTGDLGKVGSQLLRELMQREGVDISSIHNDCGMLIFDTVKQDVHSGGSGCGCSASVFCSYPLSREKAYRV